jgi:hypothetical protein
MSMYVGMGRQEDGYGTIHLEVCDAIKFQLLKSRSECLVGCVLGFVELAHLLALPAIGIS